MRRKTAAKEPRWTKMLHRNRATPVSPYPTSTDWLRSRRSFWAGVRIDRSISSRSLGCSVSAFKGMSRPLIRSSGRAHGFQVEVRGLLLGHEFEELSECQCSQIIAGGRWLLRPVRIASAALHADFARSRGRPRAAAARAGLRPPVPGRFRASAAGRLRSRATRRRGSARQPPKPRGAGRPARVPGARAAAGHRGPAVPARGSTARLRPAGSAVPRPSARSSSRAVSSASCRAQRRCASQRRASFAGHPRAARRAGRGAAGAAARRRAAAQGRDSVEGLEGVRRRACTRRKSCRPSAAGRSPAPAAHASAGAAGGASEQLRELAGRCARPATPRSPLRRAARRQRPGVGASGRGSAWPEPRGAQRPQRIRRGGCAGSTQRSRRRARSPRPPKGSRTRRPSRGRRDRDRIDREVAPREVDGDRAALDLGDVDRALAGDAKDARARAVARQEDGPAAALPLERLGERLRSRQRRRRRSPGSAAPRRASRTAPPTIQTPTPWRRAARASARTSGRRRRPRSRAGFCPASRRRRLRECIVKKGLQF